MVIDSSALLAILLDEPEAEEFLGIIKNSAARRISAASFLETGMVLRRDSSGQRQQFFEDLIAALRLSIVPVTEQQARTALEAFAVYGKGHGHPAGLNFGDCLAYALANVFAEPLLFKGNDFSFTDIQAAR
jgi:ribonuclease VapC